jgi:small redox-active disulfide protein 2
MDIKVLGPGCAKCNKTSDLIKEVLAETGTEASLGKVTDLLEIAGYGVFGTPAVVVDGEVKSVGKIPAREDIKKWISK